MSDPQQPPMIALTSVSSPVTATPMNMVGPSVTQAMTTKKPAAPRKRKEPSNDGANVATKSRKKSENAADGSTPKHKRTYKKPEDDESGGVASSSSDVPNVGDSNQDNDQYEGDDPEDDDEDQQSLSDDERLKRQREEVLQIRRSLASQLTPVQERRYEVFRNSKIDTKHIEDILSTLPIKKTKEFTIKIIGALGKLYTGELVEKSRDVMSEWGDDGPIRPVHIREAHRRMQVDGQLFYAPRKSPFRR